MFSPETQHPKGMGDNCSVTEKSLTLGPCLWSPPSAGRTPVSHQHHLSLSTLFFGAILLFASRGPAAVFTMSATLAATKTDVADSICHCWCWPLTTQLPGHHHC